jgi:hypothetical protein
MLSVSRTDIYYTKYFSTNISYTKQLACQGNNLQVVLISAPEALNRGPGNGKISCERKELKRIGTSDSGKRLESDIHLLVQQQAPGFIQKRGVLFLSGWRYAAEVSLFCPHMA